MRVGVVMSGFAPECGGAHTFEQELLQALLRNAPESSHEFEIFAGRGGAPLEAAPPQVKLHPFTRWEKLAAKSQITLAYHLGNWTRRGRRTRRFAGRGHWLQPCLQRSSVELVWFLAPAPVPLDQPYLTTVWDLQHRRQPYFPEVSRDCEWDAREATYGMTLRRATGVIAGTEVGRQEIEQYYQVSAERIHILPHPTPDFALNPPPLNDRELLRQRQLEPGYWFYPAQLWPHKNHVGLLQAVRQLRERGIRRLLVLAGSDQGNRAHIAATVRDLGLEDQVRLLGFVTRDELIALYRQAFALTYPTFFGPENLPPLEAFALGCPVIASRVAGAEEQLADAAMLADPHNPAELAAAMERLHHEAGLREQLRERGCLRARRFTGDDFVRGVFGVLDRFAAVRACWGRAA